jgi:hypothetical protein
MSTHTATPTARDNWLAVVQAPGLSAQSVQWTTDPKPAAASKHVHLRKITTATVMVGVEYASLAVNNDRETGDLPWGEWAVYPFVVTHRGTDYARLYVVDGTIRTTYLVDNVPTDRDTFAAHLTPSARNASRPNGGTITVKIENLRVL